MEEFFVPAEVYCATKISDAGKPVYSMVTITADGSQIAIRLFSDLPAVEEHCVEQGHSPLNLGNGKELAAFLRRVKQSGINHVSFDEKGHKAYIIEIDYVIQAAEA